MPLVKPKDKEKRDDFIERCMGDETSVKTFQKEVKGLLCVIHFTMQGIKRRNIQ